MMGFGWCEEVFITTDTSTDTTPTLWVLVPAEPGTISPLSQIRTWKRRRRARSVGATGGLAVVQATQIPAKLL